MPDITLLHWMLLVTAALGIGFTKSGFSGASMIHVLLFAFVFGARDSTGVVLPMLIVGDVLAMCFYGKHANWSYIRKMLPPTLAGIILGTWLMSWLDESAYKPLVGGIILCLVLLQVARTYKPDWLERVPHSALFAIAMGVLAGTTTMLANAAGPVFGLYLLAVGLPKLEFVGTAAWFFLIVNVSKLPFSWGLGLIRADSLLLNLVLSPFILIGLAAGTYVIKRIPQSLFDSVILTLTGIAALRMLFS